jgi:phage tail sheath protein FI
MLRLERAVYKVLRYVVYEGNTAYMRQRVVDLIKPYFEEAKVGGGLYDYKIVCDDTNNTPTTIDRNELHIAIGIKPTKTIEFIMVDFVLLSTGADWSEML